MTLMPQIILVPVWLQLQLLLFFGLTVMCLKWQNYNWDRVKAAAITSEQQHKKSTELFSSQQNINKEEVQQNKPSVEESVTQLCCCCWATSLRDSKQKCRPRCGVTRWQARCFFFGGGQLSSSAASAVQHYAALLFYQTADAPWLPPVASPPLISPHSVPVGFRTVGLSHKLGRLCRVLIQSSHVWRCCCCFCHCWSSDIETSSSSLEHSS